MEISPDGEWVLMTMSVAGDQQSLSVLPKKPKGATWADPPIYIDKLTYRSDGRGYTKDSYSHIFIMPVEGGTPMQITQGDFNHRSPSWSADGETIYFSSNRSIDWEYNQQNTELFSIDISSKELTQLTQRDGPDHSPAVSSAMMTKRWDTITHKCM